MFAVLLRAGRVDHARGGRKSSRPASVSGGQANPAAGGVDAGERLAGQPAAAQVGRRLVGVAGDALEQHPVRLRASSGGLRRRGSRRRAPALAARSRRTSRMSNSISAGEREALGRGDEGEAGVAHRERLAVLGADVRVLTGSPAATSAAASRARAGLGPGRRGRRWRRARVPSSVEDHAPAQVGATSPPDGRRRPLRRRRSGRRSRWGLASRRQ